MKRNDLEKMLGPESMNMLEADPLGKRIIDPDSHAVKLSVPEHLRTGKVWETLQEQTKERAKSSDTLPRKEK